jgi:LytS/YehU family sensor histidine kinase
MGAKISILLHISLLLKRCVWILCKFIRMETILFLFLVQQAQPKPYALDVTALFHSLAYILGGSS